jgi:membrane protein YqaA with SNARE-associated domain
MTLDAAWQAARATAHHPAAHQAAHGTLRWLARFGIPGLFVVAALDTSVCPIPIPACTDLLLLLLVAGHPDTWLVYVLVTIAAAMLGSYTSYRIGKKGGEEILDRWVPKRFLHPIRRQVEKNGFWSVAVSALLPPPMPMTPVAIAAGALKVPTRTFLIAFGCFRFLQYLAVGWLAHIYGRRLMHWWRQYAGEAWTPIVWTLVVILVLGIAFGAWKMWQIQKRAPQGKKPLSKTLSAAK